MSKLSEIMFKEMLTKEIEFMNHKVTLRALTTKDNIELDIKIDEANATGSKALLEMALKMLSRAIVNVDGVAPDSPQEVVEFLNKQDTAVVFNLLGEYQKIAATGIDEIKN